MNKTKNFGLNVTDMTKDGNEFFNFDTDLGDNFRAIDNLALSHRNITNCILEIPKHIKYDLVDGVLTIKSGSIVAVPYGSEDLSAQYPVGSEFLNANYRVVQTQFTNNKFFVLVKLQNDSIISIGNSGKRTLFLNYNGQIVDSNYSLVFSGDTAPEVVASKRWYDTSSNYIKECININDGFVIGTYLSLPLMVVTTDSNNLVTSIDSISNGFGYIGSTVFALPGVKGLIPYGRNEDESLKNNVFVTNEVITRNFTEPGTSLIFLNENSIGNVSSLAYKYDFKENRNFNGNAIYSSCFISNYTLANNTISNFQPKKPFRAVDHNDYQSKIIELEAKITALQAAVEALQG